MRSSGTGWICPDAPPTGLGTTARLLVGVLAHSGQWGGLAAGIPNPTASDRRDRPGSAGRWAGPPAWRFDRMTTVCHPGDGRVTASFAAAATHHGGAGPICPPWRGNRKGGEKSVHTPRSVGAVTPPDEVSVEAAQARLTPGSTRGDTP